MIRRPPRSTRTDTLFPYTTLFRSNETSGGRIVAARAFIGFGLTDSTQQVDYARVSGGIRGDFFLPQWRYDAYVGKSWNDGTYEIESFLIDRVAQSLDAVDNGDGTFSRSEERRVGKERVNTCRTRGVADK